MTAQLVGLEPVAACGLDWGWLSPAVEMAAMASGNWPLSAEPTPLGWTSLPRIATRSPLPEPGSVRAARDFTRATLRRWGAAQRGDDVTVVVSELLTNALRHALPARGSRPVRFSLVRPGPYLLCAVADPSDRVPVPARPDFLGETGRGLHVVASLSDWWGWTSPGPAGKVVWALFQCPCREAGLFPPAEPALPVRLR